MNRTWHAALVVALLGLPVAVEAQVAAGSTPAWQELLDRYAPTVVNLRVTLASEMEGSGAAPEESTEEVRGALVDPSGLILVWNSHLSAGRTTELFAEVSGGGFKMKVTATEVRVMLPNESVERRAFVAASDSALDLAFVQLEELPEAPLPAVDFSQVAQLHVGDELATVLRLSSTFDRTPYVDSIRIGGQLRKPRVAWIVAGGNATEAGMPYFDAAGRVAGVLVTFFSRAGDPTTSNPGRMFAELMSLGRGQTEVGPIGLFLLPAERVFGVIEQAKERARELLEERRAAKAATVPTAPGGQ